VKVNNIVNLRDWLKKKLRTHTVESASIFPDETELHDAQLEDVIGGMSTEKFKEWRAKKLNEKDV
tara:strand:- start:174 stop:368 length:195 start_codon:yes stop_codon:yes gene_type:complete